jgi:hypothetical protein
MVKKFLKIAGVKTEQEFYDKYPSEAAFYKAHPEARDLKQYRQGGQMKKLNQLTSYQGDIDGIIPKAQKGGGYGCKGNSCTQTGEGMSKVGGINSRDDSKGGTAFDNWKEFNTPVGWNELLTYNSTDLTGKDLKQYNKDITARTKSLQTQFPGLTEEQLRVAGGDSSRIRQRMTNLPRYDQASEQTFDKAYHQFYRPLMNQKTPVTVEQILNFQAQQPGGLGGFKTTVTGNYGRKKAQNGAPIGSYMSSPMQKTQMMDFSQYMNPVDRMVTGSTQEERAAAAQKQAEAASKQEGGGGGMEGVMGMLGGMSKGRNGIRRGQLGLNTPQNGSMPSNNNPFMYGTLPPLGGSTQTPMLNPNQNPPMYDPNQTGTFDQQVAGSAGAINPNAKKPFNPMSAIPIAGQIIGGIQQIKAAKKAEKEANKQFQLSGLTKQAASSRPEAIKRKYVRPEDQVINENELFPTYGVGTNYMAEDGAEVSGQVGGNETEIQNLYNPYNLYEHLGYEPLDDSERIKRYQGGGMLSAGQFGQIGQGVGAMVGGGGQGSPAGWSQALGAIPGPIGMIGGIVGSVIDGKQQAKTKYYQDRAQKNVIDTAMQQGMQGIQSQYSNVMENGGYLSHDWQPQVIASFGGHRVSDLLQRDRMMNTLRTGGHITQNEDDNDMGPVTSMAMGGELKTHWGGYAEPMSYNPYLPEGGETVMFKGQSHEESDGQGNTGIGVTYGESPVEVERNEPAIKMKDGSTGEDNMVVYGNLKIPNQFLEAIGDPKAKGKKFKHYVSDLSKQEEKLNKAIEKNINIIDETDDLTSFDQLKFFSAKANIDGANMKLKKIAEYKMNAAAVQNAINDAAAEHGLEADALARGKFKIDKNAFQDMAKWGKSIMKIAQNGAAITSVDALPTVPAGQTKSGNYWGNVTDAQVEEMKKNNTWYDFNGFDPSKKADVIKFQKAFNAKAKSLGKKIRIGTDGKLGEQTVSAKGISPAPTAGPTSTQPPTAAPGPTTQPIIPNIPVTVTPSTTPYPIVPGKPPGLISYIGDALQYIRPNTREDLDPTQLYGEMYALATNQVDPVQAQQYNPLLEQPYDISLQDQLNANQSDFNAIQRQTGYNPAAAASLAGQKYAANSKVLADQFRLNQENKAGVYNRNRGTLNQAQLQNLGILDQQMVRQETAKSKTKDVAQTALNSISDKIMKNKLDNRTLSVYENMYNYRFDKNGRAINMNPAFQPTIPNVLSVYDNSGKVVGYQQNPTAIPPLATPPIVTTGSTTTQRNGGKTPSSRNRDLVRAIKGL